MLRHVLFDMSLFENESDRANSQKRVLWLLEALTRCNQLYLQQHPDTPLIYQSGIKYTVPEQFQKANIPEVDVVRQYLAKKNAPADVHAALKTLSDLTGGGEHFREIPRIIEHGGGDCDNVASWRAAELRELGVNAKPYITWRQRPDGGTTYHVIVRWPDGSSEDPSLLLGMGGALREHDRKEEESKLGERMGALLAGDRETIFGATAATPLSAQGGLPGDFGQGLQYSIPFQTDDAYADWSPTRPQAYFANPYYPQMTPTSGPIFNTLMRDSDDFDDRFDGLPTYGLPSYGFVAPSMRRSAKRMLRRYSGG